jgi:RimJ/RimL family protein N-acetyltransferase
MGAPRSADACVPGDRAAPAAAVHRGRRRRPVRALRRPGRHAVPEWGKPADRAEIENLDLPAFLGYYERFPGYGFWAAIEKTGGAFLGWFHFRPKPDHLPDEPELGYRLHRISWGKGYATEGSLALLRKGFTELGVQRVWAGTMAVNTGSRRVMEKIGMRHIRTFHEDFDDPIPGTEHGEVEYAITRDEWLARAPT